MSVKVTWHFLTLWLLQVWSKGCSTNKTTASLVPLAVVAMWICNPLPQGMEPDLARPFPPPCFPFLQSLNLRF